MKLINCWSSTSYLLLHSVCMRHVSFSKYEINMVPGDGRLVPSHLHPIIVSNIFVNAPLKKFHEGTTSMLWPSIEREEVIAFWGGCPGSPLILGLSSKEEGWSWEQGIRSGKPTHPLPCEPDLALLPRSCSVCQPIPKNWSPRPGMEPSQWLLPGSGLLSKDVSFSSPFLLITCYKTWSFFSGSHNIKYSLLEEIFFVFIVNLNYFFIVLY